MSGSLFWRCLCKLAGALVQLEQQPKRNEPHRHREHDRKRDLAATFKVAIMMWTTRLEQQPMHNESDHLNVS